MFNYKQVILAVAACILACSAKPVRQDTAAEDVPIEILFREGVALTLQCGSERIDNAKYTWSKNGVVLDAARDNAYTIKNPQADLEGEYQCHTESAAGVSTRIIQLKRAYLLDSKGVPVEHKVIEGKPLGLKCDIPEGYPKPTITWKIQTSEGASESFLDRRILADPNGNLWFANINKEDVKPKEKYLCIATSPAFDGERVLAEHYIKEIIKDVDPSDQGLFEQYVSGNLVAKVGELTYIYCIYGGTPLAHPDWFKDGKDVNNDADPAASRITRHNRSSGRRLVIKETWLEDQGTYTCKAANGVGKPKSHSMKLTVVSAPKYTKKADKVTSAKEGQDLVIPCQVSAVPAAKVSWTHDAKPLASSDRVSITPEGLRIKNAQKSDKGYYGCRAQNQYGDVYTETLVQF